MALLGEIDTLIFDVDDTLYPVSTGFSDHRNGEVICEFMLQRLGFESRDEAMRVRHEYFERYHSSMKGLAMAGNEGKLPKPFQEEELAEWFADHCNHTDFLKPDTELADMLVSLRDDAGLKLVVFSNAPRRYVLRCLDTLAVRECFRNEHIFGVEDVLPACKPEAAAFERILQAVGSEFSRSVMFEDSMKNIRACNALGMNTVLIDEEVRLEHGGGEAALLGDVPCGNDPAVGACLQDICQMRDRLPCLWQRRFAPVAVP